MDPINGLNKLAELIRRKGVQAKAGGDKAGLAKGNVSADSAAPAALALERQIEDRLRQLHSFGAPRAALRRVVIESVLVGEYRSQMRNEPKFVTLVNQVQRHMESEPEISNALEKLIAQWLR